MTDYFSLAGKIAVVTGGASGIGLATAQRFRAAGAEVVIGDLAPAGVQIADEMGARFVVTDVSDEEQVAALMQTAVDAHGQLDIAVNNAGIAIGIDSIEHEPAEAYRRTFEVNVMGVVHGIKHAARRMSDGGAIVNTASMAGVIGFPGFSDYAASKWSVIGLTKTASVDLGPKGIRVNAVCPTGVKTAMGADEHAWQGLAMELLHQYPRGFAEAANIAAAIHFLASDDARFVNGHALPVDGGGGVGPSVELIEAAVGRSVLDSEGHYTNPGPEKG